MILCTQDRIRIAGHPQNIMADSPLHWRVRLEHEGFEREFARLSFAGNFFRYNPGLGTDPAVPSHGMAAWISFWGQFETISDSAGHIQVRSFPQSDRSAPCFDRRAIRDIPHTEFLLAASKERIRGHDRRHWRGYVGDNPTELPLQDVCVEGEARPDNYEARSSRASDERNLLAWIWHRGRLILFADHTVRFILA